MPVQLAACVQTLGCPLLVRVRCRQQGSGRLDLVKPTCRSAFPGVGICKVGLRLSNGVRSSEFPRCIASAVSVKELLSTSQPTFYDLLEISRDVSFVDIKQAYRLMARKYHPDVCPANQSEESTKRFIEIQEAYETLSDPRRRAIYDRAIANGFGPRACIRKSWDFRPWDVEDKSGSQDSQQNHWRSQWQGQLNGLRRKNSMKAHKAESWAARVRRQGSQMNGVS
eukprot:c23077_g1_i1 orf=442-1116(-)